MRLSRTIRTRPRNGVAVTEVLGTLLVSELVHPSREVWLVSGWVSDVAVLANPMGELDDLFVDGSAGTPTLSDVLARLSWQGTRINVAVREDPHNEVFLELLRRRCAPGLLSVHTSPDLHEKVLCGDDWVMKGSMNFTWSGLNLHEESIELVVDPTEAASHRLQFSVRWGVGDS